MNTEDCRGDRKVSPRACEDPASQPTGDKYCHFCRGVPDPSLDDQPPEICPHRTEQWIRWKRWPRLLIPPGGQIPKLGEQRRGPRLGNPRPHRAMASATPISDWGQSLGALGVMMGIFALMLCWIPLLGLFSIPIGLIGALFAALALVISVVKAGPGFGYGVLGLILCGLALTGAAAVTASIWALINKGVWELWQSVGLKL